MICEPSSSAHFMFHVLTLCTVVGDVEIKDITVLSSYFTCIVPKYGSCSFASQPWYSGVRKTSQGHLSRSSFSHMSKPMQVRQKLEKRATGRESELIFTFYASIEIRGTSDGSVCSHEVRYDR